MASVYVPGEGWVNKPSTTSTASRQFTGKIQSVSSTPNSSTTKTSSTSQATYRIENGVLINNATGKPASGTVSGKGGIASDTSRYGSAASIQMQGLTPGKGLTPTTQTQVGSGVVAPGNTVINGKVVSLNPAYNPNAFFVDNGKLVSIDTYAKQLALDSSRGTLSQAQYNERLLKLNEEANKSIEASKRASAPTVTQAAFTTKTTFVSAANQTIPITQTGLNTQQANLKISQQESSQKILASQITNQEKISASKFLPIGSGTSNLKVGETPDYPGSFLLGRQETLTDITTGEVYTASKTNPNYFIKESENKGIYSKVYEVTGKGILKEVTGEKLKGYQVEERQQLGMTAAGGILMPEAQLVGSLAPGAEGVIAKSVASASKKFSEGFSPIVNDLRPYKQAISETASESLNNIKQLGKLTPQVEKDIYGREITSSVRLPKANIEPETDYLVKYMGKSKVEGDLVIKDRFSKYDALNKQLLESKTTGVTMNDKLIVKESVKVENELYNKVFKPKKELDLSFKQKSGKIILQSPEEINKVNILNEDLKKQISASAKAEKELAGLWEGKTQLSFKDVGNTPLTLKGGSRQGTIVNDILVGDFKIQEASTKLNLEKKAETELAALWEGKSKIVNEQDLGYGVKVKSTKYDKEVRVFDKSYSNKLDEFSKPKLVRSVTTAPLMEGIPVVENVYPEKRFTSKFVLERVRSETPKEVQLLKEQYQKPLIEGIRTVEVFQPSKVSNKLPSEFKTILKEIEVPKTSLYGKEFGYKEPIKISKGEKIFVGELNPSTGSIYGYSGTSKVNLPKAGLPEPESKAVSFLKDIKSELQEIHADTRGTFRPGVTTQTRQVEKLRPSERIDFFKNIQTLEENEVKSITKNNVDYDFRNLVSTFETGVDAKIFNPSAVPKELFAPGLLGKSLSMQIESKVNLKGRQEQIQSLAQIEKQQQIQSLKLDLGESTLLQQNQSQLQQQRQLQLVGVKQSQIQVQQQAEVYKQAQKELTSTKYETRTDLIPTTRFYPELRTNVIKPKPKKKSKPMVLVKEGFVRPVKTTKAFEVIGKSEGKLVSLGRGSFGQAFQKGSSFALGTPGRTFALKEIGTTVVERPTRISAGVFEKFRQPTAKSRLNKLGEYVFVQKTKYAISSPGEKAGIPGKAARLRKLRRGNII